MKRYSTGVASVLTLFWLIGAGGPISAQAQQLDVDIIERASDDLDTCAYGQVSGLKADGDGFLAVRKGPGSKHAKIDELKNGDKVWLFDTKGKWIGVVYGVQELSCSPIDADRPVQTRGKKGWVHQNWVEVLAG
jgi:hypothetical protein